MAWIIDRALAKVYLFLKSLCVCPKTCFCASTNQVLQCSMDRELNLYSDVKEQINPVAILLVAGLTSQPVDHEINGQRKHTSSDVGKPRCLVESAQV